MFAELPVEILFKKVVWKGLCTRCGTCAGVCPVNNITIPDPLGDCLPEYGDRCTSCGLCLNSCPGDSVEFGELEKRFIDPDGKQSDLIGRSRKVFMAHATDEEIRKGGASGGVVTAILLELLERKSIDGAFLFSPGKEEGAWRSKGRVASTREEIVGASQSRYYLSPMNASLNEVDGSIRNLAYVGLPCHIHGLRKALLTGWKHDFEISPVIGIYCGNNLYFEATRALLKKMGVKSLDEVEKIEYREGAWPGNFYVRKKDSAELRLPKLEFNQAIPFFINERCLLCVDLAGELSDISVGDGWMREGDKMGWSVVITRTELGDRIIRECAENGSIYIEEIGVEDAELMHSHAFDLKKVGSFLRISIWKKLGRGVPVYDREPPKVGSGRKVAELFVSLQFIILSSRFGRALFRILPMGATGSFFKRIRNVWIRISRGSR